MKNYISSRYQISMIVFNKTRVFIGNNENSLTHFCCSWVWPKRQHLGPDIVIFFIRNLDLNKTVSTNALLSSIIKNLSINICQSRNDLFPTCLVIWLHYLPFCLNYFQFIKKFSNVVTESWTFHLQDCFLSMDWLIYWVSSSNQLHCWTMSGRK